MNKNDKIKFKKGKGQEGLTLVELLIIVALIGIIIQASYSILSVGTKTVKTSFDKGMNQDDFRMLKELLTKELRHVSYLESNPPQDEEYSSYYSLAMARSGDQNYYLSKQEYKNNGESEKTKLSKLPDGIQDMEISYSDGMIGLEISLLEEKDQNGFNILAENNLKLNKTIELSWDQEMFYAYPKDKLPIEEDKVTE